MLIPVFCVFFIMGPQYYPYAGIVLVLSGLSDMFDGFLARKLHQETELGKILDPVADKLTLGAVVVSMWFVYHKNYPWITLALGIMFLKELLMAIGGLVIVKKGRKLVKAKWWGKVATVIFYASMIAIVALNIFAPDANLDILVPSIAAFAAVVMLAAFGMYFRMALKILRGEYVSGVIDFEQEKLKKTKSDKEIA
ncbi:MAG: CDP-alcohol phosphatidyltransferase family protein [Clostridia bacterium]|nr:CDP-alcohol phosphatidyltransferase family protein [Clostridia bacterium]